jgi:branched-chain amino acid transport system ATP-binding protein
MPVPVLEADNLYKSFGSHAATKGVSLQLLPGARHALIGPNGAGKTTLVHLLSGVLRPQSGKIHLLGRDVTTDKPHRRVKRGLVRTFQINNLFVKFTVLENVYLAVSEARGFSLNMWRRAGRQREVIECCHAVLESLHIGHLAHRQVSAVAYGQQRLVELAIALALSPKILLLDEPAAGIPSSELHVLLDAIHGLPDDIAILMIEHDMQMVKRFAASVSLLVDGELLMTGTLDEVMNSQKVRSVYLGSIGQDRLNLDLSCV